MKSFFVAMAWLIPMAVILYAAVNPTNGIVYQSPLAAVGIGLIGLGMMKHGLAMGGKRRA